MDTAAVVEPTREEREEHDKVHCPYAAWCDICLAAKIRDAGHKTVVRSDNELAIVEIDYASPGTEIEDDIVQPILIAYENKHCMGFGRLCQYKGRGDQEAIRAFCPWLMQTGYAGSVRLRCDSEPAIMAVAQDVARMRGANETILEITPVGSSSSLGGFERFSQTLVAQIRAYKLEVQKKWNVTLMVRSPVYGFMVDHA